MPEKHTTFNTMWKLKQILYKRWQWQLWAWSSLFSQTDARGRKKQMNIWSWTITYNLEIIHIIEYAWIRIVLPQMIVRKLNQANGQNNIIALNSFKYKLYYLDNIAKQEYISCYWHLDTVWYLRKLSCYSNSNLILNIVCFHRNIFTNIL